MRDAVTFEARGIPVAILVNDVFEPIAHATAALLDLPAGYVAKNIVWLPHPTSNLTATAAAALIDERIERIRAALLGREQPDSATDGTATHEYDERALLETAISDRSDGEEELIRARTAVDGLASSLRADGAELVLTTFEDGVLEGELRIGESTCDDGSCIMPADALSRMIEALVKTHVPALRSVALRERKLVT
jgi:hypothetical protein